MTEFENRVLELLSEISSRLHKIDIKLQDSNDNTSGTYDFLEDIKPQIDKVVKLLEERD